MRAWTDEPESVLGAAPSERGILRQEPRAGVNGVGVQRFSSSQYAVLVEITLRRGWRTKEKRGVSELNVWRFAVRFRVHGKRSDSQRLARANDAAGDLAAVGYHDRREHLRRAVEQHEYVILLHHVAGLHPDFGHHAVHKRGYRHLHFHRPENNHLVTSAHLGTSLDPHLHH